MTIRLTTPGTTAARAHRFHEIAIPWSSANWTTSGLATIEVTNIALVMTVAL